MNIGEKIHEYEETGETFKDFNNIFKQSPLKATFDENIRLEIGSIVGIGRTTVRKIKVYDENDQIVKEFEHDFYPHFHGLTSRLEILKRKKITKTKKVVKPRIFYQYEAVDSEGRIIGEAKSMQILADILKVSHETIRLRVEGKVNLCEKKSIAFDVIRTRR